MDQGYAGCGGGLLCATVADSDWRELAAVADEPARVCDDMIGIFVGR